MTKPASRPTYIAYLAVVICLCGCATKPQSRFTAANLFRRTASESPAVIDSQLSLGRLAERRSDFVRAKQIYRKVAKRAPSNATAKHRLGVILAQEGQIDDALEQLSAAQAITPSADILADIGYAHFLNGNLESAKSVLQQALDASPNNKRAINNLALVAGHRREYEESLALFRRANGAAQAHANLAYVMTQNGELRNAADEYHRALDYDKDLKLAAHALVQIQDQLPNGSGKRWKPTEERQGQLASFTPTDNSTKTTSRIPSMTPRFRADKVAGTQAIPQQETLPVKTEVATIESKTVTIKPKVVSIKPKVTTIKSKVASINPKIAPIGPKTAPAPSKIVATPPSMPSLSLPKVEAPNLPPSKTMIPTHPIDNIKQHLEASKAVTRPKPLTIAALNSGPKKNTPASKAFIDAPNIRPPATAKPATKAPAVEMPAFEIPEFEVPDYDVPEFDAPETRAITNNTPTNNTPIQSKPTERKPTKSDGPAYEIPEFELPEAPAPVAIASAPKTKPVDKPFTVPAEPAKETLSAESLEPTDSSELIQVGPYSATPVARNQLRSKSTTNQNAEPVRSIPPQDVPLWTPGQSLNNNPASPATKPVRNAKQESESPSPQSDVEESLVQEGPYS